MIKIKIKINYIYDARQRWLRNERNKGKTIRFMIRTNQMI